MEKIKRCVSPSSNITASDAEPPPCLAIRVLLCLSLLVLAGCFAGFCLWSAVYAESADNGVSFSAAALAFLSASVAVSNWRQTKRLWRNGNMADKPSLSLKERAVPQDTGHDDFYTGTAMQMMLYSFFHCLHRYFPSSVSGKFPPLLSALFFGALCLLAGDWVFVLIPCYFLFVLSDDFAARPLEKVVYDGKGDLLAVYRWDGVWQLGCSYPADGFYGLCCCKCRDGVEIRLMGKDGRDDVTVGVVYRFWGNADNAADKIAKAFCLRTGLPLLPPA